MKNAAKSSNLRAGAGVVLCVLLLVKSLGVLCKKCEQTAVTDGCNCLWGRSGSNVQRVTMPPTCHSSRNNNENNMDYACHSGRHIRNSIKCSVCFVLCVYVFACLTLPVCVSTVWQHFPNAFAWLVFVQPQKSRTHTHTHTPAHTLMQSESCVCVCCCQNILQMPFKSVFLFLFLINCAHVVADGGGEWKSKFENRNAALANFTDRRPKKKQKKINI